MEVTKDFSTRHWKIHEVAKAGDKATKKVFYTTDSTSGSVWLVKPGQEVKAHEHPAGDDFWVCIQGKGIFFPELGKEVPVEKGDVSRSAQYRNGRFHLREHRRTSAAWIQGIVNARKI